MEIIYMLIVAAVAIALIHLLWIYLGWIYGSKKLPRIKFFEFFKLYKVNKEKWRLLETSVVYNENANWNYQDSKYEAYYELGFSFLEYLIYIIWQKCDRYIEDKNKNAKVYIDFCHAAKEDFEKIKEDKK